MNSSPIAMALHGGAGPDSVFIRENLKVIEEGLLHALNTGYRILEQRGASVDAVEAAVMILEDNPLFNAGRGSVLTTGGFVEMDAAIMSGNTHSSGAVTGVRCVKNPVKYARYIMDNSRIVFQNSLSVASEDLPDTLEQKKPSYFITPHQHEQYRLATKKAIPGTTRSHGTVGCVALDASGNVSAATSTGGVEARPAGRISDSCVIGAGCYAGNESCAASGTGDGELLINQLACATVARRIEFSKVSPQEAADELVHRRISTTQGDIGIISLNVLGEFGISFNSARMPRVWKNSSGQHGHGIYR